MIKKPAASLTSLKPLKISCTSSRCSDGLHCFKKSRQMAETERGHCRTCGADLIDWKRVQKRNLNDANFVFAALKSELIRHHFWHVPVDIRAVNHARRKGYLGLYQAAKHRLIKSVASANNPRDGIQTPYEGNVIYYAQHAVACCCRSCIEYWHGIPKGTELSEENVEYFTGLVMKYIQERLPGLEQEGEKVPPLKRVKE